MGAGSGGIGRQFFLIQVPRVVGMENDGANRDVKLARLWQVFFTRQDQSSREHLFEFYRGFADRIALALFKRYSGLGVCADDFLQNAHVGLYCAIERYRDNRGARFETFAAYRIKGEVINGLKHYSEYLDIYQHRKKLEKERIDAILTCGDEKQDVESMLSFVLDLATSSIIEVAQLDLQYMEAEDVAMNETELATFSHKLTRMISRIPSQLQQVLAMHYFYEHSFSEIADSLGKSKSSVFNMHSQALHQLRTQLMAMDKEIITV